MNKIFIRICFLACLGLTITSCEDYLDINTSPNSPSSIGDKDLILADMTSTTSYNLVGGGNFTRMTSQWMQHTANNAAPPSNDTYRFNTSSFNNEWAFTSYAGILINGQIVIDEGSVEEQWNHVAIAKILMAHNYALLSDFFSEIPLTEALLRTGNLNPKFDNQESVFQDVQRLLDEGIAHIDQASPITVGGGDFLLGGDMTKWRQFAHALKARYHMRLTNAPGYDAQTQAQLALDALADAMTGPADEAAFVHFNAPGQEAPWFQWLSKFATGIQTGQYFINKMISLNDPRLSILADTANGGGYIGHPNGTLSTTALATVSNIGQYFLNPAAVVPLMTYAEQKFIEAEAELWMGNTPNAEAAYDAGIREHMNRLSGSGQFGTVISDADQTAYIAANPLNDLEDVINQKYIAAFVYGSTEAYHDFRRTGFPNDIPNPQNADFPDIPTRIPYTDTELNNNIDNVPANITPTSKVWWDGD